MAVAVFTGKIKGTVLFMEKDMDEVSIDINLTGLKKNHKHGFHIHEFGDLSDGCESMCAHFNPFGKPHGGPQSKNRHVGDLGNIQTDSQKSRAPSTYRFAYLLKTSCMPRQYGSRSFIS